MATLALSLVGNAILPGVGGYLGAAVGAFIDQTVLFPPPDTKGPRLDSLALSSASEGTPISFCLGNECRVPGEYIWASPLIEKKKKEGKGGPGGSSYTYSADVAVAICEGPINNILKIWANSNLIYDAFPDIDVVNNTLTMTKRTVRSYNGGFEESYYTEVIYGVITSPAGGPDLTLFKTGKDVVISGWSTAGNNGTFRVRIIHKDPTTGVTTLWVKNASAANDAGGETVTMHQDLPSFSTKDFAGITFYLGSDTQLPNSIIEAYEGTGNVPGYRNIAYFVIDNLQLRRWGNNLPQIQALVEESSGTRTIGEAITKICNRSKLSADLFDTSQVVGDIRGYFVRGPQPLDQQLRPLLLAYDILTQEDNGVLKFFNRANAEVVELLEDELVAHEDGENPPRPYEITTRRAQEIPATVVVNYSDSDSDYQAGSQTDVRNRFVTGSTFSVDLQNLVLSAAQAKVIARRILWTSVANAKQQRLQLGFSRIDILENDIVTFTIDSKTHRILLNQVDQGQNGVNLLEGVTEEASTLAFDNVVADVPADYENDVYVPPEIFYQILDVAPLRDEELDYPGYYVAVTAVTPNATFQGASLYVSTDGGSSYTNVLDIANETTMGVCTTTLGNASYGYVDNINTVTVEIFQGDLESVSQLDCFAGANWALIGTEIVGFMTATLTATRTYVLSGLLRGMRSTENHIATHAANESFVLLSSASMDFRTISQSRINSTQSFKCIPAEGLLGDVDALSLAISANNLRPFSPHYVRATRNGSNDVTVTWVRRTRAPVRLLGGTGIPLAEEIEKYQIDILNVPESAVLATVTVTGATTTTILDSTITTLGLISGAAVHLKLYQISAIVGRSKAKLAVV